MAIFPCLPMMCARRAWLVSELNSHESAGHVDVRHDRKPTGGVIAAGKSWFIIPSLFSSLSDRYISSFRELETTAVIV